MAKRTTQRISITVDSIDWKNLEEIANEKRLSRSKMMSNLLEKSIREYYFERNSNGLL